METNTCRREECGNAASKQQLCHTHYLEEWYAAKTEPCSISECERKAWSKGLCLMHYKRQWRHGSPDTLIQVGAGMPLEERINRVGWTVTESGCWEWNGRKNVHGYGELDYGGTSLGAHRAAYVIFKGEIEDGLFVCHSCDNRGCMNPDHLWLGTGRDNMADMVDKNRSAYGVRSRSSVFTDDDIRTIRSRYALGNISQSALARQYGVSSNTISCIVRRVSWKRVV